MGLRRFIERRWPALLLIGLVCVVVFALLLAADDANSKQRTSACPDARRGLTHYSARIRQHRFRLALPLTAPATRRTVQRDCARVRERAYAARTQARTWRVRYRVWVIRMEQKWGCIHRHEAPPWSGGWRADTGNGYYGGLQMDRDFQRAHGWRWYVRWGTADNWPRWAQWHAAEDAHETRGFHPWPTTARLCGLL